MEFALNKIENDFIADKLKSSIRLASITTAKCLFTITKLYR